jgi:hypothetical protein
VTIENTGDAPLAFDIGCTGGAGEWDSTGFWHQTGHRAHDGTSSWYYGIEGDWDYDNGSANSGTLLSPQVTIPETSPELTFWQWRQTEGGSYYDVSYVQISTDDGGIWNSVYQSTDNSSSWVQATVDLSSYAGQSVHIRFYFDTKDAIYNSYEGWYLDEIAINGNTITGWISSIVPLEGSVAEGGEQTVTITFNSAGLDENTQYTATLEVFHNGYNESSPIAIPIFLSIGEPGPSGISSAFPIGPSYQNLMQGTACVLLRFTVGSPAAGVLKGTTSTMILK